MRRKGLGILLVLCLLLGALTLSMGAAEPTGTPISTPDELISLMNGDATAWAQDYYLTQDIDLTGVSGQSPIGTSTAQFKGTFDGNGKTVRGVNLVDTATAASANANWGFFGYVQGGTIRNLTLEGTISTTGRRAGMVGAINASATIENCTNKCTVNANANAAGIVGYASPSAGVTVNGCKNYGEIASKASATPSQTGTGGILGSTGTSTAANAGIIVSECANYGDVTGVSFVGGIVGYYYGADTTKNGAQSTAKWKIYNCMNAGTVTATTAGQADLGGILGIAWQVNGMHSNYNRGKIVAADTCTNVGGIVGRTNGVAKMAYSYNAYKGENDVLKGAAGKISTSTVFVSNYFVDGMTDASVNSNKVYADSEFAKLNTNGFWLETTSGPELKSFHVHDYQSGTCTTCGEEQPMHTPDYVWKFDGTNYYYTCAEEGCGAVLHTQTEAPTIYVDAYTKVSAMTGNDENDGLTEATAVLTIEEAFRRLVDVGGTVCLCDRYYVSSALDLPANSEKITVTSAPKTGFFFEKTNLRVRINGDVEFNNLYFYADKAEDRLVVFVCNWHDVTFGEGLATSVKSYVFAGTEGTEDDTETKNQTLEFRGVNQTTATGGEKLTESRRFYDTIVLGSRTNGTSFTNVTSNKTIAATFGNFVNGDYTFEAQIGTLRCATSSQSVNADIENCKTTVTLNDGTTVGKLTVGDKNMNTGAATLDELTVALNDNATVTGEISLFNIKSLHFAVSSGDARTVKIPVKLVAAFSDAYTADGTETLDAAYGTHSFAADTGMADGLLAGVNYNEIYAGALTVNLTDECTLIAVNANGTYARTCETCGRSETVLALSEGTKTATSKRNAVRFGTEMTIGEGAAVEKYGMFITALADQTVGSGSFADENFVYAEGTDVSEMKDGMFRFAVDLVGIPEDKGDTPIYAWAYVKLAGVDELVILPFAAVTASALSPATTK